MAKANVGWSEAIVAGHVCAIFEPANLQPHGFVLLYLHDLNMTRLDAQPDFVRQCERHGLRVIAPESGRSWWTDRIFAEFDEQLSAERYLLGPVLQYVVERWGIHPPRIGLLGIGMGGQGALRLAFKHPHTFPVVAAISPAIDYQLLLRGDETLARLYLDEETARQDTATLHVHPLNWPRQTWFCCDPLDARWYESAERLRMKLAALGIPHTCDLQSNGGGHGFEYYNRMAQTAIDYLVAGLDAERRRLV